MSDAFFSDECKEILKEQGINPEVIEKAIKYMKKGKQIDLLLVMLGIRSNIRETGELRNEHKRILEQIQEAMKLAEVDAIIKRLEKNTRVYRGMRGSSMSIESLMRAIGDLPEEDKKFWETTVEAMKTEDKIKEIVKKHRKRPRI